MIWEDSITISVINSLNIGKFDFKGVSGALESLIKILKKLLEIETLAIILRPESNFYDVLVRSNQPVPLGRSKIKLRVKKYLFVTW